MGYTQHYGWSIVLDVYLCEVVKRPNDQVHMAAHIHSLLWRDYLHLPVHAMWTAKLLWPVGIGLWPGFQMDSVFSWPVLTHTHTQCRRDLYLRCKWFPFICFYVAACNCAVHKRCHDKVLGKCPGSARESRETQVLCHPTTQRLNICFLHWDLDNM